MLSLFPPYLLHRFFSFPEKILQTGPFVNLMDIDVTNDACFIDDKIALSVVRSDRNTPNLPASGITPRPINGLFFVKLS
jgi:hypothetical protein